VANLLFSYTSHLVSKIVYGFSPEFANPPGAALLQHGVATAGTTTTRMRRGEQSHATPDAVVYSGVTLLNFESSGVIG